MRIARALRGSLCLMGLSVSTALAENPAAGVEAGVGISRISQAVIGQSSNFRPGGLVGVYGRAPVSKTISVQAELVYVQKYSRLTTAATGETADFKLNYLEIPVLAKLPLFKGLYILEGAAFGFPLRARVQPASGAAQDIRSQTTRPDIGLVIGGGVPIQKFAIEGRYDGGLRNINRSAAVAAQRHRSFSVLARLPV